MKYRAITCFGNSPGYDCEVYLKIESATIEQMKMKSLQSCSPEFKFDSEHEVIKIFRYLFKTSSNVIWKDSDFSRI